MNPPTPPRPPQPRRSNPIPPLRHPSVLFASLMLFCGPILHAQTAPTITVQPASQTNLPGAAVTFTVAANGAGPYAYQWRFNGTNLPNNLITTVAGGGSGLGDGGLATNATLGNPQALTLDAFGNLYLTDQFSNLIRKVDTNGLITTIAGNNSRGFAGDGGQATSAELNWPSSIAFDAPGNLYFSDSNNNRIRRIDTNGLITTVAGNGDWGLSGDGGPATAAGVGTPQGLAFDDQGNLYIADWGSSSIRKVDTNGIITTFAGNGNQAYAGDGGPATNASFFYPVGLARDASGRFYVGDSGNCRVRMVDTNGIITTVAGNGTQGSSGDGGPAINANLSGPWGVAVDAAGNLFIADYFAQFIRKVDTNGIITTVAGTGAADYYGDGGPAVNAALHDPCGLALDALGHLYIADSINQRIREVHSAGNPVWSIGHLNPADAGDYSVVVSGRYGSVTSHVATLTVAYPPVLTVQPLSQTVLAGSSPALSVTVTGTEPVFYTWYFAGNNAIQTGTNNTLTLSGVSSLNVGDYFVVATNAYGSATSQVATLTVVPTFITVQPVSQLAVLGSNASFSVSVSGGLGPLWFLWCFNGTNLLQAGTDSTLVLTNVSPASAGSYTVVITNTYACVTSRVATLTVGLPPTVTLQPASQTNLPGTSLTFSVAASGTGPFAYQWRFNDTDLPVIITTVAGNGTQSFAGDGGPADSAALNRPSGVAIDAFGSLYVADQSNHRIRKVDPNGLITTVAGNGSPGFSGDGGPATNAALNNPQGMAFDASGNLYFSDQSNNRIRKLDTSGIIGTVAGNGSQGFSGDGAAATNAALNAPQGLAFDDLDSLYFSDVYNNRIRKVDINGIITTFAGNGGQTYAGDGGPAVDASLFYPYGLARDASGRFYIGDWGHSRVRMVNTNAIITTVAGNGIQGSSGDGGAATGASLFDSWGILYDPWGVALDAAGNLYIADHQTQRIRRVDTNGIITTVAGNGNAGYAGDGGSPTSAHVNGPCSLALDSQGNLYIADSGNNRIREVCSAGHPFWSVPNVSLTNAGTYTVVVSSPYGCTTSTVATLTVAAPPVITSQPLSQTAVVGASPSFSVEVLGPGPFGYLWYFAGTNLVQSSPSSMLTLVNAGTTNTGAYIVVVTNSYGSVTSQVATLTVAFPPSVTTQPISHTNLLGTVASLSVNVDGTGPVLYQWRLNGTNLPNNFITTVAGNGSGSFSGDSGAATGASLNSPCGVAFDNLGNLFIADTLNHRIRKVSTSGVISTVAGTGVSGYSGDGGAATSCKLNQPCGLALDASQSLYIADYFNNCIRKVDTNGVITTVAGNGSSGFAGDGGAATNARLYYPAAVAFDVSGNLYIADHDNNRIRKVSTNGLITTIAGGGSWSSSGDGGPATNAAIDWPRGVALDASGNLFIAVGPNNRIRKVDTDGIITTVAGTGGYGYSGDGGMATNAMLRSPAGIAFDASGNLYLADSGNYRLRKVDPSGIITTVAGTGANGYSGDGGIATNANLGNLASVALDPAGRLYICDAGNHRIRKMLLSSVPSFVIDKMTPLNAGDYSVVITSPYGSVTSQVATLSIVFPPAVTIQPVSQFALLGSSPSMSATATGTGPFGYQWYFNGTNLLQGATSNILTVTSASLADSGTYTVVVTNNWASVTSSVLLNVGNPPSIATQPASRTNNAGTPAALSVAPSGTGPFSYQWRLNGTNLPNNIITTVAGNGTSAFSGDGGAATNASLTSASGIALDACGNLYIADGSNHRIRRVDTKGIIMTVAGNGNGTFSGDGGAATNASLNHPSGVAVDPVGNLLIVDGYNHRIRKVDVSGIITTVAGTGTSGYFGDGSAAVDACLYYPLGAAYDLSGSFYISDKYNNRIRKVDASGIITTVAGNGSSGYSGDGGFATNASLTSPAGAALDAAGNLYIADASNRRIRKVDTNGLITTVAGNGSSLYWGEGVVATNNGLNLPFAVTLDSIGNLYIAVVNDHRILKVDTYGLISTLAGNGTTSYSGDGGAATNAGLRYPDGLGMDLPGNLYVADDMHSVIRKIALAGYPSLSISNVAFKDNGDYSVVVSSPYGSVTSQVATLSVAFPPVVTIQPLSQLATVGSSPSISASATGAEPFGYQWYFNGTNLLQNATSNVLTFPSASVADSGTYTVVVSNVWASTTSQIAVLNVAAPPSIAIQPASRTNIAGTLANLSVTPAGTGPFTYQWRLNGTNLADNIITTVAGNHTYGFSGDGGAATNASLKTPSAVALDAAGILYIADQNNQRIRKVDTSGIITTVAGSGSSGFSGDGGAATNASFWYPMGVALDSAGRLYISDRINSRVRRVNTNGIISTVAGGGSSGDGGAATSARLGSPYGLAFDASGNLYIAVGDSNRIRKVDSNGIITTAAGGGSSLGDGGQATNASLNRPWGIAFDNSNNLYIADQLNNRIRIVNSAGIITTAAGNGTNGCSGDGGLAVNARLSSPLSVAADGLGNLFLADSTNNRIRKVDYNGIITTFAGNGTDSYSGNGGVAANAGLSSPHGLGFDVSGNLYVADSGNNVIRKIALRRYPFLRLDAVALTDAGDYSIVISSPNGSVTSQVATLSVVFPPVITVQPLSQFAALGSSPSISVTATGTGPFGYRWYFNGTNFLQNATSNVLTVPSASLADSGAYTVVVTNNWASTTSQVATLTVGLSPSIATQPASLTNATGTLAALSVTPVGTGPFTYQWRLNGTNLPNHIITTVAGNHSSGFSGDGGAATNASLNSPFGVVLDASGNLYIADQYNQRVRRVDTNGIITTVAGNGSTLFSGDGAPATNSSLSRPAGVALHSSGSLYIADSFHYRVRKVTTSGIISTIAGGSSPSYSGDGGAATSAGLVSPYAVAFDALGCLYIADYGNSRIRKVDANGIITTVAGNGTLAYSGDGGFGTNASLRYPYGLAADTAGNLFIADRGNNRIRKVSSAGVITTVAGNGNAGSSGDGGVATNASLSSPAGVCLDITGNLYIADSAGNRIRRVDSNGLISTLAGNGIGAYSGDGGAAANASLSYPCGLGLDLAGNLYIADYGNNVIRKIALAGYPSLSLSSVASKDAGDYSVVISSPYGIITSAVATLSVALPPVVSVQPLTQFAALGSSPSIAASATGAGPFGYQWYFNGTNVLQNATGSVLTVSSASFADAGTYAVVVTNGWASVTSQVAWLNVGLSPSIATQPASQTNNAGTLAALSVTPAGTGPFSYQWRLNGTNLPNNIITTVAGNHTSGFSGDGGAATNASLYYPTAVVPDAAGSLYIADQYNQRIRRVDTNGIITTVAGNGSTSFSGDGGQATNASLYLPTGMALDASGGLYISDRYHSRVRRVTTNGIIYTVAGSPSTGSSGDGGAATNAALNGPYGIALDASGNLHIADNGNNRIRKVDTNGIISTVAGACTLSYSGDGSEATNANLYAPAGIGFDAANNLYIADQYNNRIRMVNTAGIISTVAGDGNAGFSGDGGAATNAHIYHPQGVALDVSGNLYIADTFSNRIRKVDSNRIITAVAGNGNAAYSGDGGAAANASLSYPCGLGLDLAGNLYFADYGNNVIRKIALAGYPSLPLDAVALKDAGDYSVVISSPYGSVTSQVATLTVSFPNTAPILPAIPNFYANVQETHTFTNLATDSDSPPNLLTYTLEPGAPEGAEMDPTNGIFSWTPSRQQAATTNLITMTVTDNGTPPLSDSKSFYVIVNDYTELWLGSRVLRVGESGSLPLSFSSSTPVTHLALSLQFAPEHLGNWAIEPTNSTTGSLAITNSNQLLLSFDIPPSLSLTGKVDLAQLNFTALSPQQSAFLPLTLTWASALRADDGTQVPRNLFNNNEIVALGQAPLMRAYLSTNAQPYLLLYGQPGTNYTLDWLGSLQAPLLWTPFTSVTLTDFTYTFPEMPPTNALRLFRARE